MMAVLTCIGGKHDHGLLLLAGLLCIAGSVAALRLFVRATGAETRGLERIGWLFLAAVVAGFAIWCTHYVATLAYVATVPDAQEPVLAAVSLLVAIGGAYTGFTIAAFMWLSAVTNVASSARARPAAGRGTAPDRR